MILYCEYLPQFLELGTLRLTVRVPHIDQTAHVTNGVNGNNWEKLSGVQTASTECHILQIYTPGGYASVWSMELSTKVLSSFRCCAREMSQLLLAGLFLALPYWELKRTGVGRTFCLPNFL